MRKRTFVIIATMAAFLAITGCGAEARNKARHEKRGIALEKFFQGQDVAPKEAWWMPDIIGGEERLGSGLIADDLVPFVDILTKYCPLPNKKTLSVTSWAKTELMSNYVLRHCPTDRTTAE